MRIGLETQIRTPHDVGGRFSYVMDEIVQRIHVIKRRLIILLRLGRE